MRAGGDEDQNLLGGNPLGQQFFNNRPQNTVFSAVRNRAGIVGDNDYDLGSGLVLTFPELPAQGLVRQTLL